MVLSEPGLRSRLRPSARHGLHRFLPLISGFHSDRSRQRGGSSIDTRPRKLCRSEFVRTIV